LWPWPHLLLGVFALLDAVNVVRVLASQSIDTAGWQAARREWLWLLSGVSLLAKVAAGG